MGDLSQAEEADVRTIDLDLAIHRAANRDSSSVTSQSLKTYQQRAAIAIQEFIRWRNEPAGYKPRGLNGQLCTKTPGERMTRQGRSKGASVVNSESSSGLTLSYPLRSDFLAQVVIPRDLNVAEAKRLGAFLLTIAADYQPE